jgi:hypothetical protein
VVASQEVGGRGARLPVCATEKSCERRIEAAGAVVCRVVEALRKWVRRALVRRKVAEGMADSTVRNTVGVEGGRPWRAVRMMLRRCLLRVAVLSGVGGMMERR